MNVYLIGSGIQASQSPALHRAWFESSGLKATYDLMDVLDFEDGLALAQGAVGANVTAPFKDLAVDFCDELRGAAKEIRSVNTLDFRSGRVIGYNTDSYGFGKSLEAEQGRIRSALVLGAGGAAKAVLHALMGMDAEITLASRDDSKARKVAYNHLVNHVEWDHFDRDLRPYDLIVNATGSRDLSADLTQTNAIIYDLSYGEDTALIKEAKENRLKSIDGSEMLRLQASKSFQIWFGIDPLLFG